MADYKQYWQELAKKAGVSEDKMKAVLEALGDPAVEKAFNEGFVETPRHHSTIDTKVNEFKGKLTEAEKKALQYEEWYNKTAKPTMDRYTSDFARLQKYEELYGKIDDATDRRQAIAATGMTKEEVDAYVQTQLKQRDAAYVNMSKDIAFASADYIQRFKGDPLDLDQVEKIALEKGIPFRQAYREMISPKIEEMRNQEIEAKVKAARDEGYKDALSKHKLPVESAPKEPHPFFERKEVPANVSEREQDNRSREAFMEGWNNPKESAA